MPKAKKKDHEEAQLVMKGAPGTYYPHTVTVQFEQTPRPPALHPSMRQLWHPQTLLPIFNSDGLSYTPAFRLAGDTPDPEHYAQKHQSKIEQYEAISQQLIMVPRPRDKRYCHVCEDRFEDYLQHTLSEKHLQLLRQDKFQLRIEKLCRKIKKKRERTATTRTAMQSDREESFGLNESNDQPRPTSRT